MKNKRTFRLITGISIIVILMMMTLVTGCNSNTKPKLGSIKGSIVLENDSGDPANDPIDFSGVTIALYELAELDTTLVRINSEYPQIGVQISQKTEFDHRNFDPIKMSQSNPDGSFELEGISPGVYNVAVLKENWGVWYDYEIDVMEGADQDLGEIELFPALEYFQYVGTDQVWQSGHTYIIKETTSFDCQVNIESGAQILIAPGRSATFYGNVSSELTEEPYIPWRIQSEKDIYSEVQSEISMDEYFTSLQFLGSTTDLNGGLVQHFVNSIIFRSDQNSMDHVIVRHFDDGPALMMGSGTFSKLLCTDGGFGLNLQTLFDGVTEVTGSIFFDLGNCIQARLVGTYDINNCYFYGNTTGIFTDGATGLITHNFFDQNDRHIGSKTNIMPDISFNNFGHSGIYTIMPVAGALINYNNFFSTDGYFINIRYNDNPPSYSIVYDDLDARYNYWAVPNPDDYILDATDNDLYPNSPCAHYVIWNPRRNSRVPDAGIQ